MTHWILAFGLQVTPRLLKVVIVGDVFAWANGLKHLPTTEMLFIGDSRRVQAKIFDTGLSRQRGMTAHIISQNQGVASFGMLKIKVDPLVFHETHDKVEIGFLVLHA